MVFVALFSFREGQPVEKGLEAYVRRTRWQYPAAIRVIGDYWRIGAAKSPEIVLIFEADDAGAIMSVTDSWSDVFEVDVTPAIIAEEGIRLMAQSMQTAPAG